MSESETPAFDREIKFRGAVGTGVGILLLTVIAMVCMWPMAGALQDRIRSRDEPLTRVEEMLAEEVLEANQLQREREVRLLPTLAWPYDVQTPSEPRVQVSPSHELRVMLEEEEPILQDYGWVDREAGTARVPIERAIETIVETGLPTFSPPEAAGQEATDGR